MSKIFIQLGDIIKIKSENTHFNDKIYFVKYLDDSEMTLLHDQTLTEISIPLEQGKINDVDISEISIIDRALHEGYALQNNLVADVWLNIHIGGDIPSIITGKITNLENDMIEVLTHIDKLTIYIDFAYKGLPKTPPIEKISKRRPPSEDTSGELEEDPDSSIIHDEETIDNLKDIILQEDDIVFGEEFGDVSQYIEVSESEKRYSIDMQTSDLFEELMSGAKNRHYKTVNKIHKMVEKFKQLRTIFSTFDDFGTADSILVKGADYRPLLEDLFEFKNKHHWILPIAINKRKIYGPDLLLEEEDEDFYHDVEYSSLYDELERDNTVQEQYKTNSIPDSNLKYEYFVKNIHNTCTPYFNHSTTAFLEKKPVHGDILAVLDNRDNFKSSVFQSGVAAKISEKSFVLQKYISDHLGGERNDLITIKGILTLPRGAMEYSHINKPTSNILKKSILGTIHFNLWDILNKDVMPLLTIVKKGEYKKAFNVIESIFPGSSIEHFRDFLHEIIPNTTDLIKYFKVTNNSVSIHEFMKELAPFLIYHDDIVDSHLSAISKIIEANINMVTSRIEKNKRLFQLYHKKNESNKSDSILKKFSIMDKYIINDEFSSEILQKIMIFDAGNLFFSHISLENMALFNKEQITSEPISVKNSCEKYIVAKQYIDEDEMNEDNRRTIYFDRKHDITHYEILQEFKGQTNMREKLLDHLKNVVGLTHPEEEADAIIHGKREIQDGHYAVIIDDDGSKKYFKRSNQKWTLDAKMEECNLQKKCVEFKDGCKDEKAAKEAIKQKQLAKIVEHFNEKYELGLETMGKKLAADIEYDSENINKLVFLNYREHIKYDLTKYTLGLSSISEDEYAESPKLGLLNSILKQQDFVKKQRDIIIFVKKYCRINKENESPYWHYCIQTDTPLIPTFFNVLAEAYEKNTYKQTLDIITSNQGEMSDDGGYVIDKHTGYIIQYIHFDTSEGYDEGGFKLVSREIMEEKTEEATIKKYKSPQSQMISNIIQTFCELMGFEVEEDNIISAISELLKQELPSKEKYAKIKKKKMTYTELYDDTLLTYTVCFLIVYVQTQIPSILTSTSFPGCKKSFEGWPLLENDDFSTITYFSCALRQLKSGDRPWASLLVLFGKKRKSPDEQIKKVEKKLKLYMKRKVLNHPFSSHRISKKREGYLEKKIKILTAKWNDFLPPLQKIKIQSLRNIPSTFAGALQKDIRTGSPLQFEKIQTIKSKIYFFSLGIQEIIQNIIAKEDPLLISGMREPFLENVCCHNATNNTLDYFIQREQTLMKYNDIVIHLKHILDNIHFKPDYIISQKDTKLVYPPISDDFSERTIYLGFIEYCRFNSEIPLGETTKKICGNNTSTFTANHTLDEKISILKKEGRTFTIQGLKGLLKSAAVPIDLDIHEAPISIMTHFRNYEDQLSEHELYNKMFSYSDIFFPRKEEKKTDIDDRHLRNYVLGEIRKLKAKLDANFKEHLSRRDYEKSTIFLNTIMNWNTRGDNMYMNNEDETAYFIRNFIKNTIKNIIDVFPSIILNKIESATSPVPKHWKLSLIHAGHIKTIIRNDYFKRFFDDKIIIETLTTIADRTKTIQLLVGITPYYADIGDKKMIFNGIVTKELYEYYLLKCFEIYIDEEAAPIASASLEAARIAAAVESSARDDDTLYNKSKHISELLFMYMEYISEQKQLISINNEEITEKTLKAKEKEKNIITRDLKTMSIEERKVENIMKNHRLGKWSVGQTSAIHKYSQEQYEREIRHMEKQALMEHQLNKTDDVTSMNREIYRDMLHYETDVAQQVERELLTTMGSIAGDDDLGDTEEEKIY